MTFDGLYAPVTATSRRTAPWDRTGANKDTASIGPGETQVLMEHEGPGCVRHIYTATGLAPLTWLRDYVIRMYWDGEETPSVEVPMGDFFCLSHCLTRPVRSNLVVVNPGIGWSSGLNCYFPMPFSSSARITIENRAEHPSGHLFHVDYDVWDSAPATPPLTFHAQWRRERTLPEGDLPNVTVTEATNLDGAGNYVALEATGRGRLAGLHLQVDNPNGGWWGEGDDMVFVDGDTWPPSIHGTGTEEVFGGGACPNVEYTGPWTGMHLIERTDFRDRSGMYRWLVPDPISFHESLRWTIEHGHANNYESDYTSVAYWYQSEPHGAFPALPPREQTYPRFADGYDEATAQIPGVLQTVGTWIKGVPGPGDAAHLARMRATEKYYAGDFTGFLDALERLA